MSPDVALEIADRYARPDAADLPTDQAWWHQSLAHGAPGVALLHTELAAAGLRPFQRVHDWLTVAVSKPVTTGASTGMFYGAPAVARALAGAAAVRPGTYRSALKPLTRQIAADVHNRVDEAHTRIDAGVLPLMAEFDAIRGLAGVGAYLLHHDPSGTALRAVLGYLVRLTRPVTIDGESVPGWWTSTGPTGRVEAEFPGGHGNFGLAHGICGSLAVLAQSLRQGITVDGQPGAIETICTLLDSWRLDTTTGHRWPYMITRDEVNSRPAHLRHSGATRRPSWCYGTAGIARSLQLAALATGDSTRRRIAEDALLSALTDPTQDALITDGSLCHGYAGLARITTHAANDADEPTTTRLRTLATDLLDRAPVQPTTDTPGLLEGAAGIGLAALAPVTGAPTATNWDTCLLIT
jgi:lantibiotic biosynthesis protein